MSGRGRLVAGLAIGAVAVALGIVVARLVSDGGDAASPTPVAGAERPSRLVVLSVTGAPHAMLTIVGSGGDQPPASLVLPPGTMVVAPGQGETTIEGVAALQPTSMRVAVSNAIGGWIDASAVTDLEGLAAIVDRVGGLTVNLPEAVTLGDTVLGPGTTAFDGTQVAAFVRAEGDDAGERWALIVQALLADADTAEATGAATGELATVDDAALVAEVLGAAAGASVELAPTAPVAATALVLDQPAADELVRELFGLAEAVRVLVQNGNGEPGIGEEVARLLLPNGFRVVLSQNADTFRHKKTEIAATEAAFAGEAERVRELLGVGTVAVSQVPSGLADITIVVGRDFTA